MNVIQKEAPERQEIEALLPWHATGTLSRRDSLRPVLPHPRQRFFRRVTHAQALSVANEGHMIVIKDSLARKIFIDTSL